jgi:hypothetical protein
VETGFGKDHAQTKVSDESDSTQLKQTLAGSPGVDRGDALIAFLSEAETGSRQENASKQNL